MGGQRKEIRKVRTYLFPREKSTSETDVTIPLMLTSIDPANFQENISIHAKKLRQGVLNVCIGMVGIERCAQITFSQL
jgi:hypothetical protein